ncbi:UNVERIFIED_CONTAM: hypothetical protein GTU68_058480 [Idotea baltica]|nr:hypothetical protein [Idotea baltica]
MVALLLVSFTATAREYRVSNQQEYRQASENLEAGDTVVLANGVWQDFEIVFEGVGSKDKPIVLTAQDKGQVVISGMSNLRLAGEYLLVSGLVFKNGQTPSEAVISFRKNNDELANHSRVTETVIEKFSNPERFESDYWVALYGKHNRFDHNHLEGKRNKGVTMAVRMTTEASRENHHLIDHNYFGPRPILGSNGGETLRIGTSHYSRSNSLTRVENNYFDRCDGELEIVSNKSGGNVFKGNVFYQSRGTLTLRHGQDTVIEENVFFGNGADHTGGIRVINKRQTIRNNYLEGLAGYRFGGALVVMNGVPNSPINRYDPVEDALIENNTLVHSEHIQLAAGSDVERSAAPSNSHFRSNLIYHKNGRDVFTLYDDVGGISFVDNVQHRVEQPQIAQGFSSQDVTLERAPNGLLYPVDQSLAGVGVTRDITPITKDQTGVDWYPKPGVKALFATGKTIDIEPAEGALTAAVSGAQSGDTIRLAAGNYLVSKILVIDKPLTFTAAKDVLLEFERSTLFEIVDGGSLYLKGLSISGKSSPDYVGNSVIRTSRYSMLDNYQVKVEDCDVSQLLVNRFFNFMSVSKSTMADNVEISNSTFSDVSGAILKLDAETDDYGIYNAEYVTVTDSSFTNIQGALVDYYRGGTDESTFGPHFSLTGSQLNNVGVGSKNRSGASIYLHGVQVTAIADNQFENSAVIKVSHTVGEPVTRIVKNTFTATPLPDVVELYYTDKPHTAVISGNTKIASGEE